MVLELAWPVSVCTHRQPRIGPHVEGEVAVEFGLNLREGTAQNQLTTMRIYL